MVEISSAAARTLLQDLRHLGASSDEGLRLTLDMDGEYALVLDSPKAKDRVLRHKQSLVLIVDPEVDATVGDWVLDMK